MPANETGRSAAPIFSREALEPAELAGFVAAFERDGFVAMPAILTAAGAQGLADEILQHPAYHAWLEEEERRASTAPAARRQGGRFGLRPHNDKGPWTDQTIDAPLIQQLVSAVMAEPQLCHTSIQVSQPGAPAGGYHQDHKHFQHY